MLATVACASSQGSESGGDVGWSPCGEIVTTELGAGDEFDFVVPGLTVSEALASVADIDIPMVWVGWGDSHLDAPAPESAETTLRLKTFPDSAVVRGYATEVDDAICEDWVSIRVDTEISTEDGFLSGITDAEFTLKPRGGEMTIYFSTEATTLGLVTAWPAEDERPIPDEVVLRGERSASTHGLGSSPGSGGLWVHWVWFIEDTRIEEIVSLSEFF